MREKLKKGFSRNWRLYVLMMPALLWAHCIRLYAHVWNFNRL